MYYLIKEPFMYLHSKQFHNPSHTSMGALVLKIHYTFALFKSLGLGYDLALNSMCPPLKDLMPMKELHI